jgi:hypothetical protein
MHVYGANVSSLEFIAIGFHSLSVARWRMLLKSTNFIAHFISNSMTKTMLSIGSLLLHICSWLSSGSVNWKAILALEDTLGVNEPQLDLCGIEQSAPVQTRLCARCKWGQRLENEFLSLITKRRIDDSFRATDKSQAKFLIRYRLHSWSIRCTQRALISEMQFINEVSCLLSLHNFQLKVQLKATFDGFILMVLWRRWCFEMDLVSNDNKASHRFRALFQI